MVYGSMSRFNLLNIVMLALAWAWVIFAGPAVAPLSVVGLVLALYFAIVAAGVSFPQLRFFGPMLCRVKTDLPFVAFTFDDGPDPDTTPALLDALRAAGVKAAFFCVGEKIRRHPGLARRIFDEGHLLANHTYSHHNLTNFFSVSRLIDDLSAARRAIEEITGAAPVFFRPPMGLTNPRVMRAARELGLLPVGWTVRGLDTPSSAPEKVVERVMKGVAPGAIILLHDGKLPGPAMSRVIAALAQKLDHAGFRAARLDELH